MKSIINFLKALLGFAERVDKTRVVVDPDPVKVVDPTELEKMTKAQLEAYGKEEFGVDLDRRKTKAKMIEDLLAVVDASEHRLL